MINKDDNEQDLFDELKEGAIQGQDGRASIKGRPNIDEISKRNEEEEKRDKRSSHMMMGIIILIITVVILLVYFFS